ncbi:transmembrane protein 42 [Onthophagus taurus]|uniref:transmembrane protein 42 n=1 Tax=Onthophagus taurus TaxID=166361 RepID=UPI000C205637|nr:transmembrane protein 42-like [Onthophagus taurus]XP_022910076.1 transmembrane protein 42-like [Onthophagus taurus]
MLTFKTLTKSYQAITSGSFAAAGSIFGKLTGHEYFEGNILLKLICFILMLICNACVWTFFVKALQNCKSSLSATLISTSTNYIVTALFGFLIFEEVTSILWWFGSSLVVLGLILIVHDQEKVKAG